MGKRNIHILIEKFFENDLSPEIQKKFHAWLLDRNFQEEKEKAMVTLWEEKSAVANESTFQELSRLHKRIEASDRMLHKPIGLYIKRIAAILLLPLLGAFGTYYYLTKVNPVVEEAQLKECFVANGEQKQVKLPDGTKVWLNSGSLLVYDKHFRGKRRLLFLNGEARFQVAKDPAKPFLVKTAHMTVKALGTVFNLNAYSDQDVTIATLDASQANWLIYQENCRHTTFAVAWCFRYLLLSDKSKSGCGRSSIERMFRRKWRTETSKTARWDESLVELRFFTGL